MGALFAVVYCVAYGRVGNVSARALSVLVAGGMLVSLWIVPALKYPPNPPATSLDETIKQRTLLYLLMVALSALLMVAAVYLGRQLTPKLGAWNATLVARRGLPRRGARGDAGPADDQRDARADASTTPARSCSRASRRSTCTNSGCTVCCTQVIIWATIGLVFGAAGLAPAGRQAAGRASLRE